MSAAWQIRSSLTAAAAAATQIAARAASRRRRPQRRRRRATVPRRRRTRLAERHGHRRAAQYVTDLAAGRLQVFEDGVKQDVTLFNRPTCRSRWRCCSTRARAWKRSCRPRRKPPIGFARSAAPAGPRRGHRLRQPRRRPADLHEQRAGARAGDPQDVGRRIDVDVQRHLHRAEGSEEGRSRTTPTRSAARPSSCSPTAKTRRACCRSRRCSIWRSAPRPRSTRSACDAPESSASATQGLQGSRVRPAPALAGNRRAVVLPQPGRRSRGIYGQIADELSSQYTVGYTSKNPKRDGAWRRVVVRSQPAEPSPAPSRAISRRRR